MSERLETGFPGDQSLKIFFFFLAVFSFKDCKVKFGYSRVKDLKLVLEETKVSRFFHICVMLFYQMHLTHSTIFVNKFTNIYYGGLSCSG